MMRTKTILATLPITSVLLTACGGEEVTGAEAKTFQTQVTSEVPYMARYTKPKDFADLAEAVCSSFKGKQNYGQVSRTVGAYIQRGTGSTEVDDVIRVAINTACPKYADRLTSGG